MQYLTDNTRITGLMEVSPPNEIITELPISADSSELVFKSRKEISDILHGRDDRLVVVVGPCSIHDPESALEYAKRLKSLEAKHSNQLKIVMRVYFEKPRTTIGWKGLINDPNLDNSYDVNLGLRKARKVLLDINNLGLPAGTEFLDMITPQYLADLISWGAIGARTTESQIHRELASGLSCPVGFKNSMGKGKITGEKDYRTPISESEQFYTALKLNKVETMLVRIPNSSHSIASKSSNLIAKVNSVLYWFDKFKK